MLEGVLFGFALAVAAPWITRVAGRASGWVLAFLVAALTAHFAQHLPAISDGQVIQQQFDWIPGLDVQLSFHLDGLSLLFTLMISGIGTLVTLYAGGYLAGHPMFGRFYAYLLAFMASMLGVVLADNLLTLFVFWELTSLTSYLLIGFNHETLKGRKSALQALLVTGGGGLGMLAGLVMLGHVAGTYEISALAGQSDVIQEHALYPAILVLILFGAFTKSAQFPFHFWLPNAMEAPTPVSAYLHSSTMVKAGVYLLARMSPSLGGTDAWFYAVSVFGAVTMLVGGYLALLQHDLKRILAYSTICILGALTMLLGIGTEGAAQAVVVLLAAHALYKACLFLVAGAVDHEAGTRDIRHLGGLRGLMPITALAAGLAAVSSAGFPPFFGFISKEMMYEATLDAAGGLAVPLTAATIVASMCLIAVAGIVAIGPFLGARPETPKKPHEAPPSMWIGPLLLACGGLGLGLFPGVGDAFFVAGAAGILGAGNELHLALWHGINLPLVLSALTVALGVALYVQRSRVRTLSPEPEALGRWGPSGGYEHLLEGMLRLAAAQTRILQSGYLRFYLMIVVLTTMGLVGYALTTHVREHEILRWVPVAVHEVIIGILIVSAAIMAVHSSSRLSAVAALGVVGYGVALVYILFGAPDLAMTQFAIETLAVILFVFVLYRLPRFAKFTPSKTRVRDIIVAVSAGGMMTMLLLTTTTAVEFESRLTPFFVEQSVPEAKGRNIVNVILVDFRALDTLGEITVLAVAAVGVFALMRLRSDKEERA